MTTRKTVIVMDQVPTDGYVLTYSAIDGYFKPLPQATSGVAAATVINVSSSPYVVINYDFTQRFRMLHNGGNCQVTLPADGYITDGSTWTFKDVDGYSATYTYSVTTGSNTTIDKTSSFTLPAPYTALSIVYHAVSKNWEII